MRTTDLYQFADSNGIEVIHTYLPQNHSVSAMTQSGHCYIGIDPFRLKNAAEEKVHLAHEIGHCETGAFYNPYSELDIREKSEYTANRWAVKKLIPKNELIKLLKQGYEKWDIAEYFDVTEDFVKIAMYMYFDAGIQA
ncbi:MAG: ImmA/IrrE family metallo-endopeptidase [Ruminococcus flavefaciens]|nr:ImmA/IrrE family metallo-endopeptidase [Ruminococcus flavefaciens]